MLTICLIWRWWGRASWLVGDTLCGVTLEIEKKVKGSTIRTRRDLNPCLPFAWYGGMVGGPSGWLAILCEVTLEIEKKVKGSTTRTRRDLNPCLPFAWYGGVVGGGPAGWLAILCVRSRSSSSFSVRLAKQRSLTLDWNLTRSWVRSL